MENGLCKFKLSNFLNSRVVDLENADGVTEKGIFIPIDINGLFLTKRNQVIAWLYMNKKLHDTGDGYSHYMKLKIDSRLSKKLLELGYKTPYIGSCKPSKFATSYYKTYSQKNNRVERDD